MSIFTTVINSAIGLYKHVKGGVKFSQIIGNLYSKLPEIVTGILAITGTSDKEKIIQAWEEFDLRTGIDAGAIDVFRDIPPEDEEVMMDGFKAFGKGLTLWAAGFYGQQPTSEEFSMALSGMPTLTAPGSAIDVTEELSKKGLSPVGDKIIQSIKEVIANPESLTTNDKFRILGQGQLLVLEKLYA